MFNKLVTLKKCISHARDFFELASLHISNRGKHQIMHEINNHFEDTLYNKKQIFQILNNHALSQIDYSKKTILVCASSYRNIDHFRPLLEKFYNNGYQIVQLNSVGKRMDSCQFLFDDYPVLFVDRWGGLNELVGERYDIAFIIYYLISILDIHFIIQDEWTGIPLHGFYYGWPLLKKVPPIYCMRHSLSTFYEMPYQMKEFLHRNFRKYFVWGRYHCEFFYKRSKKVIAAGYPKLDTYSNISISNNNSIFIVGRHDSIDSNIDIVSIIIKLIANTDYNIIYKLHPDNTNLTLQMQMDKIISHIGNIDRIIVRDGFSDYINDIANCECIITWGSNIIADALVFNKPICILKSNYSNDPIYLKTDGKLLVLNEDKPTIKSILRHIDYVKKNNKEILTFRNGLISNLFCSTDFIYNEIQNDLNNC